MKNLPETEWLEALNSANHPIIIDVRTPSEWQEGAIPNSMFINIMEQESFVHKIEALDKSKDYFLYCRSGARSGQACNYMSQLGFDHVFNLAGGIMAYTGDVEIPTF